MINVVISTRNKASVLKKTLFSYLSLKAPNCGWKIIIIDNASTDNTGFVISNMESKLPLMHVYENNIGKNVALNSAIKYFNGDLIVFTDDDVLPNSNWLIQYERLMLNFPDYDIFGGRILPLWPDSPPVHILESIPLGAAYAVHPESINDGLVDSSLIWGGNMAVRSKIFSNGYRFNEHVGPACGSYIMGSESEFLRRLSDDGYKSYFSNALTVLHQIDSSQLKLSWIWKRAVKSGKGSNFNKINNSYKSRYNIFRYPRWILKRILVNILLLIYYVIIFDKKNIYKKTWRIAFDLNSY